MPYIKDWTDLDSPYEEPEAIEPELDYDPESELEYKLMGETDMETDRLDSQIASIVKTLQIRYPHQKVKLEIQRQYDLDKDKHIRVITYEIGDLVKIRCLDDDQFKRWTKKLVTGTD